MLLETTNPDVEREHLQAQQQLTQARRRAGMDSVLAERELVPVNEARRSQEVAVGAAVG